MWKAKAESVASAALVLAVLLACKGGSPSSDDKGGVQADDKPQVQATAVDLYAAYHANEVAADEKYKGKRIALVGVVNSIEKDAFDNMIVSLDTKAPLQEVHATMRASDKGKVAALSKGQGAILLCIGGGMILGSPMVNDCTIYQTANIPTPGKK